MAAQKRTKKLSPITDKKIKKSNGQAVQALIRGEVIHPAEFRSGAATWRIFRIMAEFVDGYDFLADLKADVTVFGSARTKPSSTYYKIAVELGEMMAKAGYSVITGGGPGIMEAANKGAYRGGGESIGLNIQLPFEQRINPYVKHGMGFRFFFTRKVMLTSPSQAFVAFPGGYGTLDEVMEVLTLMQTHKMQPVPMVLVGKKFWNSYKKFLHDQVLVEHDAIRSEDLNLFHIVDSAAEAMKILKKSITADQVPVRSHAR